MYAASPVRTHTVVGLRAARGHSQEAFAREARLNRAYMGRVERALRKWVAYSILK